MLRYVWLLFTLAGWVLVWTTMPRLPPWVVWIPVYASSAGYLYGWMMHKRNWLIYFWTGIMWFSVRISYAAMEGWTNLSIPIASVIIGKGVLALGMVIAGFLTFANYRVSLNFIQRRGNIDKEQLVRLHPSFGDWGRLKKTWRKVFRRKSDDEQQEIILNLGEEVPFKE